MSLENILWGKFDQGRGADLHTPWRGYSMGDEPKVIVLLAYLMLPLTWRPPQPPHSSPQVQARTLALEEGYHSGRKMLLQGQKTLSHSPSACPPALRKGPGQRLGRVIPLCPTAAGATPRLCQAPRRRSGRPPPQTHRTPEGHCPCLGPATGSQRNLE